MNQGTPPPSPIENYGSLLLLVTILRVGLLFIERAALNRVYEKLEGRTRETGSAAEKESKINLGATRVGGVRVVPTLQQNEIGEGMQQQQQQQLGGPSNDAESSRGPDARNPEQPYAESAADRAHSGRCVTKIQLLRNLEKDLVEIFVGTSPEMLLITLTMGVGTVCYGLHSLVLTAVVEGVTVHLVRG